MNLWNDEAAMIAIASRTAPGADLCAGALDHLPWPDATFDAVTGFNSLQFADDPVGARREWARVTRPGGTDGSYRLENEFRYAISSTPSARRTRARS